MRQGERGFTLIEALVAIIIGSIFVLAMVELYVAQVNLSSATTAYNLADQLAYNNMRIYANGHRPNWFKCTYSGTVVNNMVLMDDSPTTITGIKGTVVQRLVASAPFGCGNGGAAGSNDNIGYPILVTSTVTYQGRTIAHATYANY